jgi:hypothetical protein
VGSKYLPTAKDLKAAKRYHQGAKRAESAGVPAKSIYFTSKPAKVPPAKPEE